MKYRKQKNSFSVIQKIELEKRWIIFQRANMLSSKSEFDLILILNETLQQIRFSDYIQFYKVDYSQSGAISRLLIERSNVEKVLKNHCTILKINK